MAASSSELIFRGIDGPECTRFLRAVKQHALSEGKANNDAWTAAYAKSCFASKALRWLLSRTVAVQNNWTALQLAMLDQYPDDPSDPTIPTPPRAAPPVLVPNPGRLHSMSGRIRILEPQHHFGQDLFIADYLSRDGVFCFTTSADPLIVRIPSGSTSQPCDIECIAIQHWLGLRWSTGDAVGPGSSAIASICINTQSGVDVSDDASTYFVATGPARSAVWEVASNCETRGIWIEKGCIHHLTAAVTLANERIFLLSDFDAYRARKPSHNLLKVRLIFEPCL